jgi:hypothetical protein
MAAMFEAQDANWEETQEKMSQLVSPASAGFLFCSRSVYLMNVFFLLCLFPVPSAYTIILEELRLIAVESRRNINNISSQIDLYLLRTFVTGVVKKVRLVIRALITSC